MVTKCLWFIYIVALGKKNQQAAASSIQHNNVILSIREDYLHLFDNAKMWLCAGVSVNRLQELSAVNIKEVTGREYQSGHFRRMKRRTSNFIIQKVISIDTIFRNPDVLAFRAEMFGVFEVFVIGDCNYKRFPSLKYHLIRVQRLQSIIILSLSGSDSNFWTSECKN